MRTLVGALALCLLAVGAAPPPAGPPAPGGPDLLVTDQASRRVLLLDGARGVWDPEADPAVVKWAFSPVGDARYADLEPARSWVYPDEAKVRVYRGRVYVLVTASFGFAAVVEYPSGRRHWGDALAPGGIEVNPHSIELLPDGRVAVAGSTGDVVRLYAAEQGPVGGPFASYRLDDAHGLQWDERRGVLWALGGDRLVALRAGSTRARPTLSAVFETPLPSPHGHDLARVAGRADRLWVTTGSAVYQYAPGRNAFLRDFAGAEGISRARVKSVGDEPVGGRVASTVPEGGLGETWWTREVTVHRPAGAYRLVNGGLYKARWWLPAGW